MDFAGRYVIPAPPEVVWEAINNPDILKPCIPGCQEMAKVDATHFEATAKLKIGPVSATFRGKVALDDLDPPRRCVLIGEGQGGVAGFAKGSAEILLTPEGSGTALAYNAKATVGGKLAQIGQRLIDGAAKQLADDFFGKFANAVGERYAAGFPAALEIEAIAPAAAEAPAVPTELVATSASHAQQPAGEPELRRDGMAPEIWVVGLVAVIVILLVLFGVVL